MATPLLTRVYSPEAFGIYSVFFSALTILALFGSGRYEHAIVLQNNEEDVYTIVDLIVLLSIIVSVLLVLIFFGLSFFGVGFMNFGNTFPKTYFVYFPLLIVLLSLNSGLTYVLLRGKQYLKSSIVVIVQSASTVFVSLFFGYFIKYGEGLILGFIIGNLVASIFLLYYTGYIKFRQGNSISSVFKLAKSYIKFPKYLLLSDFSATASQHITPILLLSVFDSFIIGNYSMASRFLRLPTLIIATALTAVLRNDFALDFRGQNSLHKRYLFYIKGLLIFGLVFFSFVYFLSPYLFTFLLGKKWDMAGVIAQLIIIMVFFEFISIPFNSIYSFYNKQHILMGFQIFNVVASFAILYFMPKLDFSFKSVLFFYSTSSGFFNCIGLFYLARQTKQIPQYSNVN